MSLATGSTDFALAAQRPALRGVLHLGTAFAATAGLVWLVLLADSAKSYVGAAVFGTSLILLYWTSAGYHRITWSPTWRRVIKRVDHSMIFVLIGGTYTPFALQVSLAWWLPILSLVWALAGIGVVLKVLQPDASRWLSIGLYLSLGWVGVGASSEVLGAFAATPVVLLILGGVFYSLGSVLYAIRRPVLWPRVFGYHEVFHSLVVAGSALHFAAIAIYVLPS